MASSSKIQELKDIKVLNDSNLNLDDEMKKSFVFGKTSRKKIRKPQKRKLHSLTSREKRKLNIINLKPGELSYNAMLPINKIWKDYMVKVLGNDAVNPPEVTSKNWSNFMQIVYKVDLHGSFLRVTQSRCPSYVNKTGICIMDTRDTFKIISIENKIYTIPKKVSIFEMEIDTLKFTFLGAHFCKRPAERSGRKIKNTNIFEL